MDAYGVQQNIAYGLATLLPGNGDPTTEAAGISLLLRMWAQHYGLPTPVTSFVGQEAYEFAPNATANATSDKAADGKGVEPHDPHANPMPFPLYVAFGFLATSIIVAIIFEIAHSYYLKEEYSAELTEERTTGEDVSAARWDLKKNMKIAGWYFNHEGAVRGRALFIGILCFTTFNVGISYAVNILVGKYWDAMNEKDMPAFQVALGAFAAVTVVDILGSAYDSYMHRMLSIHWRESLTRRYWTMWLSNGAHYRGRDGFENPDQRIQVDTGHYVSHTTNLTLGLYSNTLSLFVFLPLLWSLSPNGPFPGWYWPGWLCQVAIIYAALGTLGVHLVGHSMIKLQYGMERSEADFRARLVTIRDESEHVAMVGAEDREQENLGGLFAYIKGIYWGLSFLHKRMSFFNGFFGLMGEIGPILLLTPSYFNGDVTMGALLQCRNALRTVQGNLNWGHHAYGSIADWSMSSSRLLELEEKCTMLPPAPGSGRVPGQMSATNLTYKTPDGRVLVENANLSVDGWTLVTGKEGSGKTTLLRVLKGLWPAEGEVKGDAMFLPVTGKCAGLRRGTLHSAVAYPLPKRDFTPEQVRHALDAVGLGELEDLDEEAEWGKRLSSGQFSRMQLAHVILVQPERLVLDEPTSHCAPGEPAVLFNVLKNEVPSLTSVLTVTHQADELAPFHGARYTLDADEKTLVRA